MNQHAAINQPPPERITVLQGQVHVSADPGVEMGTILGSCVAACLFDATARVGGMNHFLLAEPARRQHTTTIDEHYGVYLMELLINEMLSRGAIKQHLRAHLYGGANMHVGMAPIGAANARFAGDFLARERIELLRHDLGGSCARRVDFRPVSGQVRCRRVADSMAPEVKPTQRGPRDCGDVELF